MGTLFYDLPVTDGKSGSWTLDTFTISQEKAHMLSLRADVTGNQNEYIPPGKWLC